MTVETEVSTQTFTGIVDGIPVQIPFPVEAMEHLTVLYGADLVAQLGVHYTVTLDPPDYDDAEVTPLPGFAALSGGTITASRRVPYKQTLGIPVLATLASARLEQGLDYVTFLAQQLRDLFNRALLFRSTDPANSIGLLPDAVTRALRFLAFDGDGKPIAVDSALPSSIPATVFGKAWVTLADNAAALISLGFTTVGAMGKQVVAAADAAAVRTLISAANKAGEIFTGPVILAADPVTALGASTKQYVDNTVLNLPAFTKAIAGLTYANNGGDATNDIDIAAGGAMDATGAWFMSTAGLTKQSDVAWAAGNAAGGLDTGAVGNNDYYIWLIGRTDKTAVDILYSLSATAPTMPANYTFKRLIGYFKRASSAIVAFKTYELSGGGLEFRWAAPTIDVNSAALTTSRLLSTIKVPLNFSVVAMVRSGIVNGATTTWAHLQCPDDTDTAPSSTAAPLANIPYWVGLSGVNIDTQIRIRTSATGQVAARSTAATAGFTIVTESFEWSRR